MSQSRRRRADLHARYGRVAPGVPLPCALPRLSIDRIASAEEIPAANDAAKASGAAVLNVMGSAILFGNRQTIMQRVAALRLPAIY
jgi:hypothetical protein